MHLPDTFITSLQGTTGFEEESFKAIHDSREQVVSIRLNPSKPFNPAFALAERVPWSSYGYYLKERPSFTLDPAFHAGAYYVQEASSMFLEHAIKSICKTEDQLTILDLCAAPGGKSTLIQSIISKESVLVSNEISKQRAGILEENITKWGGANVIVTNNKPEDFSHLKGFFDVIVVDAPCSGSGLFRKDPEAIKEWSAQIVEMCSVRQQNILTAVLPCLKEDGVLIYSTCSYSESENEEICRWLVNEGLEPAHIPVDETWNIVETSPAGYRFYPDKLKGEGFFLSAFRNISETDSYFRKQSKPQFISDLSMLSAWITDPGELVFIRHKDSVLGLPENTYAVLRELDGLFILKAGILIGALIRYEIVPAHALAISTVISLSVESVQFSREEALQYLRRAELINATDKRGWIIVKYGTLNIGFIKSMGNRINNYYPKEWRILNK